MASRVFCICMAIGLAAAGQPPKLFKLVPPAESGIRFTNEVKENDALHIFKYEYLYNGHGIGVGDFNMDGLEDVFISGNTVPNKLYLNTGDFSFKDVTEKAGVAGKDGWRTGVSVADVNGDGLPDIYVCYSGPYKGEQLSNRLYINEGVKNGVPVFSDQAKNYGLDCPGTLSTQAAFFDYDLDGDLDMFLVNHSNHTVNPYLNTRSIRATPSMEFGNRLLRNDRQANGQMRFTDVTLQAGIVNNPLNFGLAVVVSDLNRDGWPDLYTTSDYTEQDYCYINNRNGTFLQTLQQSFGHISRFSMGADIADINNDGWPDVFTLDMMPPDNFRQKLLKGPDMYDAYNMLLDSGYYHQQMRNMLHLNRGADANGTLHFSEVGQLAGISNTDWSWSALFADYDLDGQKDLMVTNGYLRDFTDNDFLKYTVADEQLEQAAKGNFNFQTYELVKKMPSNTLPNYAFKNLGNLQFQDVSASWGVDFKGISNAAVYADFDNDGDLDLMVGNNNSEVLLYRNNAMQQGAHQYVAFRLKGPGQNSAAIGTRIQLFTSHGLQVQEQYPVRGYQSSVSQVVHFGLAAGTTVDSALLYWPNGTVQTLRNLNSNEFTTVSCPLVVPKATVPKPEPPWFADVSATNAPAYQHIENDFVDFKGEVLLPYQLSRFGPALAATDVNGDGLDDVFAGGAIGQPGMLYLQQQDGTFKSAPHQPWTADKDCEDVKALFFDVDGDGDADLYVASGGNEYDAGAPEYADRLYLNTGNGIFKKSTHSWPVNMQQPTGAVAVGDVDGDGDLDLFVGGASEPGNFPKAAPSYLLLNESKNGQIAWKDGTPNWLPGLKAEMITAAAIQDMNGDAKPELVMAGHWMPVRYFANRGNTMQEETVKKGLEKYHGFWNTLTIADANNDGKPDILVGNMGNNLPFKASETEPVTLLTTDIDDNGMTDPLFCYYIQGKSYPAASRDELLDQVVPLRKKFVKYRQYATAAVGDFVDAAKLQNADLRRVNLLESVIFMNKGNDAFELEKLPPEVNFSAVQQVLNISIKQKNYLLWLGNFYNWRVQWGKCDASYGTLINRSNSGQWQVVNNRETGLFTKDDVRHALVLKTARGSGLLIATNNSKLQLFQVVE
ncbi:MAG: RNA-binding protein [Bacteroidetes bacterium]|nr:MAG: RNA-binding protein [Bacteroidota bacterium]